MLGRSILASNTVANDRVFVYEVAGLRQTDQTANNIHAIRKSSTTFVQVPFDRMSDFMQKVSRIGGTIVAVRTPNEAAAQPSDDA
jgi:phycocyanin-associated, rod